MHVFFFWKNFQPLTPKGWSQKYKTFENHKLHYENKPIIDIRTKILHLRQTRVSSTKDSSLTLESKNVQRAKYSTKLKTIEDQKFLKVLPNTAKAIYSWGRKALVFEKFKVLYYYENHWNTALLFKNNLIVAYSCFVCESRISNE